MKTHLSFLILLLLSQTGRTQATDTSPVVRVLSFNILHGANTDGSFNLDVIANVITETNPDFVAMQEVDLMTNRAMKYDLATELGWRTKLLPLFGKAMSYDGGEYGEAVLSKYSFVKTRNVPLPNLPDSEPRAALEVTVRLPSGDTITFIGTHLDHLKMETDRIAQAREINRAFSGNEYPSLLAGDLNALPDSKTINILERFWTSSYDSDNPASTYPSTDPKKKIDYVMYYPKTAWKVIEKKVICDTIASDHCAYLVTLSLQTDQK